MIVEMQTALRRVLNSLQIEKQMVLVSRKHITWPYRYTNCMSLNMLYVTSFITRLINPTLVLNVVDDILLITHGRKVNITFGKKEKNKIRILKKYQSHRECVKMYVV